MARLSILSLGSLHFTLDAVPLTNFSTDKAQALLAYLAVESDRAHSRGHLAALFWPEYPEKRARHSLSQALHNVRHILGDRDSPTQPFLEAGRATLRFQRESDYWLDIEQFRHAEAITSNLQTSVRALDTVVAALTLYRGPFLDGVSVNGSPAFEEWVLLQRERLERRMRNILDCLVTAYTARHSLDQALHYAWRKLDLDPWREDAHRQVMRLLAATGNRSAALDQYQQCVRLLRDELGVEPEPETTDLYTRLLGEQPLAVPAVNLDQRDVASSLHNLPVQLTPIFGRDAERETLIELLRQPDTRLLTLTGPGGCGKTRLALEVAWAVVGGQWPQGVWFVPLVSFDSTEAVINGIASALGMPLSAQASGIAGHGVKGSMLEQLQAILQHRTALLVLDNAEHLTQAGDGQEGLAGALIALLEHAPGIKILVTSRSPLHSAGEAVVTLRPLEYPNEPDEALETLKASPTVQLFLHAARRVRPDFTLAERNQQAVAAICHFVQGCPLATLLAASWTSTLSTAEIAGMLTHPEESDLSSLDILQSDWQDFPERHRDLRSVYEHSWRLLAPKAQSVFAVCCLFRSGYTRNAAVEIAGASAFDLRALIEASLMTRQPSGRYVIHELLRQFGEEKLKRDPIVWRNARSRYTDYYIAAAKQWAVDARGPLQQMMLEDMDVEYDNLRPVWFWCVEDNDAASLIAMFEALRQYLNQRWYDDEIIMLSNAAISHFEPMLSEACCQDSIILMLAYVTILKAWAVSYTEVKELAQQAEDLLARPELAGIDTRYVRGRLHDLWAYYYMRIDRNKAREHFDQLIDIFQDPQYRWYLGWTLFNRGGLAWHVSDFPDALHFYQRAAAIAEEVQAPRMLATVKSSLAGHAMATGRLQEALQYSLENLDLVRKLNDPLELVNALYSLGFKYLMLGQFDAVLEYIGESRDILWEKFGHIGILHNSVYGWALACKGDYAQGEAMQYRAREGLQATPEPRSEAWVALILGCIHMGQARFSEAIISLQRSIEIYTPLEQWMELANAHSCLGHAYALDGNITAAKEHLLFSAHEALERQLPLSIVWTLPGLTMLAVRSGRHELAVTAYHVAMTVPVFANAQWFRDTVGQHVEAISAHLLPDVIEAAQERGRTLNMPEIVQALVKELSGEC